MILMSDKYTMSELDHELADGIEEMIDENTTLLDSVSDTMMGIGQFAAAMNNRGNDMEWIINDESTRRMYDLVLKAFERMKEMAKKEGLEPWDGVRDETT